MVEEASTDVPPITKRVEEAEVDKDTTTAMPKLMLKVSKLTNMVRMLLQEEREISILTAQEVYLCRRKNLKMAHR